jgi:two-component system, NarL family, response regulator DesR
VLGRFRRVDDEVRYLVIRILLVSDPDVVRGAIAAVLADEPDLQVVGELDPDADVIEVIKAQQVQVVVLDHGNGVAGDLTGAHELARAVPGCAVVVVVARTTPEGLAQALEGQVRGFIGTDATPRALIRAIRRVADGELVIDRSLVDATTRSGGNPLTAREREVLSAAALGLPSEEIARRLFLANGTVRNYLSASVRKTGARSLLEAVRKAREAGWL